jgi:hypothetical protein
MSPKLCQLTNAYANVEFRTNVSTKIWPYVGCLLPTQSDIEGSDINLGLLSYLIPVQDGWAPRYVCVSVATGRDPYM